jgi:hypothetical protein
MTCLTADTCLHATVAREYHDETRAVTEAA